MSEAKEKNIHVICTDYLVYLNFRGGIRDGDIIVKLNGESLMNTSDLKEALNRDTTLLLEVRRGNDDLLFNIEPDVIMQ